MIDVTQVIRAAVRFGYRVDTSRTVHIYYGEGVGRGTIRFEEYSHRWCLIPLDRKADEAGLRSWANRHGCKVTKIDGYMLVEGPKYRKLLSEKERRKYVIR